MTKKRVGRYPKEFRRMAVERLKSCDNIVALAEERVCIVGCCTNGEINWSRWRSPRGHFCIILAWQRCGRRSAN